MDIRLKIYDSLMSDGFISGSVPSRSFQSMFAELSSLLNELLICLWSLDFPNSLFTPTAIILYSNTARVSQSPKQICSNSPALTQIAMALAALMSLIVMNLHTMDVQMLSLVLYCSNYILSNCFSILLQIQVARVFSGRTIMHFTASKARHPKGMISRMVSSVGSNIKKRMNTTHFIPRDSSRDILSSGFCERTKELLQVRRRQPVPLHNNQCT